MEFGKCKLCGGETFSVDGSPYICKNINCQAWYIPQDMFVYVRIGDEEGYLRKDLITDETKDLIEIIGDYHE